MAGAALALARRQRLQTRRPRLDRPCRSPRRRRPLPRACRACRSARPCPPPRTLATEAAQTSAATRRATRTSGTCRAASSSRSTTGSRGSSSTRSHPMLDLVGKTVLATPQLAAQRAGRAAVADQPDRRRRAARALRARRRRTGDEPRHHADPLRAQGPDPPARLRRDRRSTPASALCGQMIDARQRARRRLPRRRASAAASAASLQTFIVGALAGGGIFLTLLGLACAVVAVCAARPLPTAGGDRGRARSAPRRCCCSATSSRKPKGWRSCGGARSPPASPSRSRRRSCSPPPCVSSSPAPAAPASASRSPAASINLLLCLCLLVVLVRIPFWAKQLAFGRSGSSTTVRLAKALRRPPDGIPRAVL